MANGFDVHILSDICDLVGAWQEAFLSETSLKRYRRACAFATSEVAKAGKAEAKVIRDAS